MYKCYCCDSTEKELRPYGPNAQMVCFDCAMSTPEMEAQTTKAFNMQLDAAIKAGNGMVSIGTQAGPLPVMGTLQ